MWGRSVRFGGLGGIEFKVDASWLLIATLVVWSLSTSYFPPRLPDTDFTTHLVLAFIGLAGLIASLLVHELSHALIARAQGVRASPIILYLFGGVAETRGALPAPFAEIWIAAAGPVATLGLAALLWLGARMAEFGGTFANGASVLWFLAFANMVLGFGNLIPAFPLDGGRILRAVFWTRSGNLVDATLRATRLSTAFSILLVAVGLLTLFRGDTVGGLWPVVIGLFLLFAARKSSDTVQLAAALDGRTVADLMSRDLFSARPDQSLSELVSDVFLAHDVSFAPVLEDGVVLGYVDIHMVRCVDRENRTTTVVDDVIESISDENSVSPDMPGQELTDRIRRTGRRKFMVVAGTTVVGVVTLADLVTYLRTADDLR